MADSIFRGLFDDAFAKLLEVEGETVTYTTSAGVASSISAIFDRMIYANDEKQDGHFHISDNASTGIASPNRGDTVTHESVVWTVIDIRTDDDGSHELRCVAPYAIT